MSIRRIVPIEQSEWSVIPVYEWVRPRSLDWSWQPPESQGVVMLLFDEQHDIATQAVFLRIVRMLTSLTAVQSQSQVAIEFDPAAQCLRVHELVVWRLDPDGVRRRRTPVRQQDFLLRQREQQFEQQILNGRVSLVALLEDVRVGDAIDLAYTLEPRDPMPGLLFTSFHFLVWGLPVGLASVALNLHPDHPVRWQLFAPADARLPVESRELDRVCWQIDQPALFQPEANVSGGHWPFPVLEVTAWESWGEIARFFSELWADALNDETDTIAAEAASLAANKSIEAAILEALRFVQEEVRYLAIDFGHGAGMLPSGAGTVLRRRFGDCKDKSVLLTALLRALGLSARPMLVATSWRHAIARLLPSTACFNHAIVAFEFAGKKYFVDPTVIGQAGNLADWVAPPLGFGLEIDTNNDALVELPSLPVAELILTETFTLDRRGNGGAVAQKLLATSWFADEFRASVIRSGLPQIVKTRADVLKQHFPALLPQPDSAELEDDRVENRISLLSRHGLPTWGPVDRKPPDFFGYGAHGLFLAIETLDDREQRTQPFALRHPLRVRHQVIVRGKPVRKLKPEVFRHEGPGFRYCVEVSSKRREVRFDYSWESTAAEISPEQWQEFCRERRTALDRAGATVHTQALKPLLIARRALPIAVIVAGLAAGWLRNAESNRVINEAGGVERAAGMAFEHVKRREFSQAYELANAVRSNYRNNFEMQILFAEAALRTGHFQEADEALREARKLRTDNPLPDQLQAALYEARGELGPSRDLLIRLAAQPGAADLVFSELARLSERMGDPVAARKAWEMVLARQPAQPEALFSLARLLWSIGERDRADALIPGVIAAQPTPSAVLQFTLARFFSATGRPARAVEPARRAAELSPNVPEMVRQHAMALLQAGDRSNALSAALAMTEKFPNNPLATGALAMAAAMAGENVIAETAFKGWVEQAPDDPDALSGYGFFLHRSGRGMEAKTLLAEGTRRFPGHGNLWLNYAVVLEALGDSGAVQAREQASRLLTDEQRATLVR